MKNKIFKIGALSIIALVASACGANPSEQPTTETPSITTTEQTSTPSADTVKVTGIKIDEKASVDCDWTKKIEVEVLPATATNKAVTWESKDPTIASVDKDGVVTGKNAGVTTVVATTVDDGLKAEIEITVSGFHKGEAWTNFGKIENNDNNLSDAGAIAEIGDGIETYKVLTDNEAYTEVQFNRGKTWSWASFRAWYDSSKTITSFDLDVELVKGTLPGFLVELAGANEFKQFVRVPLTLGQRSTVSINMTDYNIKGGEEGIGSWGFVFFEFNNPMISTDDAARKDKTNDVTLRIHKSSFTEGEKKAPAAPTGLRFDEESQKLMLKKDTACQTRELEVYKVEGDKETKLDLDVRPTRFVPVEDTTGMQEAFIPKKTEAVNQNFADVPGTYKARAKSTNSAGSSEWCEFVTFTVAPKATTSYVAVNLKDDGKINLGGWNSDKENPIHKAELKEDGYHLSYKDTKSQVWDNFYVQFDNTVAYSKFEVEFTVLKGSVGPVVFQAPGAWNGSGADPDHNNQHWWGSDDKLITAESGKQIASLENTKPTNGASGNFEMLFETGTAFEGDVEIVITKIAAII